ncbi:MAG: response regulator [Deltaproteobacteria bacterium]
MEKSRILVIDDEEVIRDLLAQTLTRRGYHVEPAEDGPAALKKVSSGFFNLLITDLKLPGMNGIEVLKQIKKVNPYIEVIIITGYPTIETAVEAIKVGAFDFLCKPFDIAEIVAVIQRCLEKQRNTLDHIELGELNTFFEISKTLTASSDLGTLLRQMLHSMLTLVRARSGSLLLFEEGNKEVRLECQTPDAGETKAAAVPAEGAAGGDADSRLFLSMPLKGRRPFSQKDVLGVINVSEKVSGDGFSLREQTLFSVLCSQAAATIENYRLYAQLQEKVKDLEQTIRELEETRNQLIQTEKLAAVGQLAFGIAHEIRNPLSIILEGVEFIQTDRHGVDQPPDDALVRIERAVQRANNIIVDLLKFSRASKIQSQSVDIGPILEAVCGLIENTARLRQVRVHKEWDISGRTLQADPNMLQQVFFNLSMNAIDAMPQGGELTLSAWRQPPSDGQGAALMVAVRDTGTGIPAEIRDKMFNPFFTTKEPGKGTGLGLSIVHMILERHGAVIEVDSEVGRGTTFVLRFPLQDKERAQPATAPAAPEREVS